MSVDLEKIGKPIGSIDVQLRYKIIELFSGHLYSSPTKAIEELVVNSYDAFATECVVSIPETPEGRVWVWDNGDSMDQKGMEELWLVAESRKRDPEREKAAIDRGRKPIGRFGIGKLASYVLGSRISHICRKNDQFLAVTMDYTRIEHEIKTSNFPLTVRELSQAEVEQALGFVTGSVHAGIKIDLLSGKEKSWTVVVVDHLKQPLQIGKLRWILSTAMPLIPDFRVFLNNDEVEPSKEKIKRTCIWQIGKEDKTADEMKLTVNHYPSKKPPFDYSVTMGTDAEISGTFELFVDPLDVGKSSDIGYSNGYFIKVRNRLLNLQDNLFGITTLPHGVGFNRFRAVVNADFLDSFLKADREGVEDVELRKALANYLANKFTKEVRAFYEKQLEKSLKKETLEEHLQSVPGILLRYPLQQAMDAIGKEEGNSYSIRMQQGVVSPPTIETIETKTSDPAGPLATLEAGTASINATHPFYRSFDDYPGIKKLAIAEILLEAYILASGVELERSNEILMRRDQLLRVLASKFPEAAIEVAELIRHSVSSKDDLEIYCVDGFRVLGFDAIRISGSGEPDGLATAHLGVVEKRKYVVMIDTKSTQDIAVQSGNIQMANVVNHRKKYHPDCCVVIAPEFQVSKGEESKAVQQARSLGVCLLRTDDFADLIAASAVKPLSLERLKELFMKNSPQETTSWIDAFKKENPSVPPIKTILEAIWRMQTKEPKDVPSITAIRYEEPSLKDQYSSEDIKQWLQSLSRLVPDLIHIINDQVELDQPPQNIVKQCELALNHVSKDISAESVRVAITKK